MATERVRSSLRIAPIEPDQNEAARKVIFAVAFEFFGRGKEFEVWQKRVGQTWLAQDVDELATLFARNGGAFWVLLDGEEVVGTGDVKRIDEQTCELKRMYLLPRVRGLGWGRRLTQTAIEWARQVGFQVMRLDTDEELVAATALYQTLGFKPIPRYKETGGGLFFELKL